MCYKILVRKNLNICMLALAGVVCAFYLATLRTGQGWMDDYAQYALHAANLAEGKPYRIPGYIFNPDYQYTGPVTYPPVFPLLLAPVYKVAGFDLRAMKGETVFFFSAFLYLLFLLFRDVLPGAAPLIIAGLVGFNPVFWKFKDYLYSEYPFLFFSFAALYVYGLARRAEDSGGNWRAAALGTGLLTYLACGTRTAGALLVPSFLLSDLLASRRFSKTFIAAFSAAAALAAVQTLTLHSDAVYVEQARAWFRDSSFFTVIFKNLRDYPGRFMLLFDNGFSRAGAWALLAAVSALAAAGFAARLKAKAGLLEVYAVIGVLFLLVCPAADGIRYGFTLVPLLFCYAFLGWAAFSKKLGGAARYAGPALLLLTLASYGDAYSQANYGAFKEGTEKTETKQLFEYVSASTAASDIIIFRKPRTLLFYTGRASSMYQLTGGDDNLAAYIKKIGAGYVITGCVFPEDISYLQPFMDRHAKLFRQVYANNDFRVYKVL